VTEYDRQVIEDVRELLHNVRKRLKAGAEGEGAVLTLSSDECLKLEACIKSPPDPPGKPPQKGQDYRQMNIAHHCLSLEGTGMSLKAAIQETMQYFGCKRTTVYACRKVHAPRRAPSKKL